MFESEMDKAYQWLMAYGETSLSAATQMMIDQLNAHIKNQRHREAWMLIDRTKGIVEKSSAEQEMATVIVECGKAAYALGNLDVAISLLETAALRYTTFWHNYAAVKWMLGAALWNLPGRQDDAIIAWQQSLNKFEQMINQPASRRTGIEWYQAQTQAMRQTLQEAIAAEMLRQAPAPVASPQSEATQSGRPTQAATAQPEKAVAEQPKDAETEKEKKPAVNRRLLAAYASDRAQVLPFVGSIPAGSFGATGKFPRSSGQIEIDRLLIDEKPHRIVNLRDKGRLIKLPSAKTHTVFRVAGDSMNRSRPTPIKDGDYVLIRKQEEAGNGDIVAAEIFGVDHTVTLKRLSTRGLNIALKAESDNPIYTTDPSYLKEFTQFNEGFHIYGIALAVFKPIPVDESEAEA
jgi:tetratricopeptide (TPR) repeat protein